MNAKFDDDGKDLVPPGEDCMEIFNAKGNVNDRKCDSDNDKQTFICQFVLEHKVPSSSGHK